MEEDKNNHQTIEIQNVELKEQVKLGPVPFFYGCRPRMVSEILPKALVGIYAAWMQCNSIPNAHDLLNYIYT